MDVSGQRKKFFGLNHLDILLSCCRSCLAQIKFLLHWNDKDEVFPALAHCNKCLVYLRRVFTECRGNFCPADSTRVTVEMRFI